MNRPRVIHLESLDALRAAEGAWDDLWQRSDATLPSLRAELLAQWVEQFARPCDFHAVAVEDDGRLVAALPLVRRRLGHVLTVAAMPCNEWSASGELLLDAGIAANVESPSPSQGITGVARSEERRAWWPCGTGPSLRSGMCHPPQSPVLDILVAGIRELRCSLLWLDEAVLDSRRWGSLSHAFASAGMNVVEVPRWQVGRVAIDHDWENYKARWSRKHRQQMAHAARELAERGEVRLEVLGGPSPDDIATAMQQCFAVEERSWKGPAGGAVLRNPGLADFFIRQAQQAACWGQLELVTLRCGGRTIAFDYGLSAKGVFHSLKIGYDPAFSRQHPGQLLRYYLLERLFADPTRTGLDFLGSMTESHAAWLPQTYTVGRLVVATRGRLGHLAAWTYKNLWRRLKRQPEIES
ncbi:MAG: GNAT family N-acetyltransferase [Thermoguttaceae bacterium]